MRKTDTLWTMLADTRKNFVYGMDEIARRKLEMDSQMQLLRMADPASISEESKSVITQYNSVFRVYKPIANNYRNVVLETEDVFFRIKALEKSVREGVYDQKLDEFKATWAELHKILEHTLKESTEIAEKLKSVEPAYLRLAPKVDDILALVTK